MRKRGRFWLVWWLDERERQEMRERERERFWLVLWLDERERLERGRGRVADLE